jgi:hypothetical protein
MAAFPRSLTLLAAALLATTASAGEPMTENSHPLELVLQAVEDAANPRVEASIHNPTGKRVFVQIKVPEVFAISARLTDAGGADVEGMHTWANKGAAQVTHRFEELAPGESLLLDSWAFRDDQSTALGGGWRWDLREQRGQTLGLVFTFRQECAERTTDPPDTPLLVASSSRPRKVKDIFCGELASPPLSIEVPPWTRENVLSTLLHEPVESADAYEILVADALTHESEPVRQNAAYSLGQIGRPEAAIPLAALLADPNREARGYAARALGTLKNPEVLPALKAAMDREQDDWVKGAIWNAIEALER